MIRWFHRTALALSLALLAIPPGCQKRNTDAVSIKTVDQVGADDIRSTLQGLGFEAVAATTSRSGGYANVSVVGFKQDPAGELSADGKKRVRVVVSIHDDPKGAADRSATLDGTGAAFKTAGQRTISVELSSKNRSEAKKILDAIVR